MGVPGSVNNLLGISAGGYQVSRSLRFNSADSAYLSKSFGSAGNRKTFTFSAWIKRSALGNSTEQTIFSEAQSTGSDPRATIRFTTGDALEIGFNSTGSAWSFLTSTAVYRDPSAWLHLVVSVDTTQVTPSNRTKVYVNGLQITTWSTEQYVNQDTLLPINLAQPHAIGRYEAAPSDTTYFFNGYLADIHFIDGQALDPTSFTETDATTGQLIPKAFTGSYGTNGFKLTFADNSAATATTLGKDSSPNGNNWTPNNLSVTAGAGNDSLVDSPTNYGTDTGVGGEVRGNYCTWSPIDKTGTVTLTNGNLDCGGGARGVRGTIAVKTGKWYYEAKITTFGDGGDIGWADLNFPCPTTDPGAFSYGWSLHTSGLKRNNGTTGSYGSSQAANDVIMCALDLDNSKVWWGKNGTWFNSGDPAAGTNAAFTNISGLIGPCNGNGGSSIAYETNFGQRAFAYTAPSGFKALNTSSLPAPVITKPSEYMDVALFTGNGSSQNVTGLNFAPDFVWAKKRSAADSHLLFDVIRGATVFMGSDTTNGDQTLSSGLTAFNSDGFSWGSYGSGGTFAAWAWDAGSSTVTNTDGSIISSVRANATAGFSVVTYTGTGSNATVGHGGLVGLDKGMIIVKRRNSTANWMVGHGSLGWSAILEGLNTTNAAYTGVSDWNSTAPTSTVFSVSSSQSNLNANGGTYVAYCFAPVAGYSSFGSYTGNGSTDGPFVFTGFRVRWLLIKRTQNEDGWLMLDAARNSYNVADLRLEANSSGAESDSSVINVRTDFCSNGFKLRGNWGGYNQNAETFIYAAFAESPFKYARAR